MTMTIVVVVNTNEAVRIRTATADEIVTTIVVIAAVIIDEVRVAINVAVAAREHSRDRTPNKRDVTPNKRPHKETPPSRNRPSTADENAIVEENSNTAVHSRTLSPPPKGTSGCPQLCRTASTS